MPAAYHNRAYFVAWLIIGKLGKKVMDALPSALDSDFLRALKRGELRVPGALIIPLVEAALERHGEGVSLTSAALGVRGLELDLAVKKAGLKMDAPVRLRVITLELDRDSQKAHVEVTTERPLGKNLMGKLAVAVVGGILEQMVATRITAALKARVVEKSPGASIVEVDLASVPEVRRLLDPMPVINRAPVEFFAITGVKHEEASLVILGQLNDSVQDVLRTATEVL